ncbi:MAG: biotin synthase BioB, partial [Spirochaetes bacterium]|nr:biotin synthase BioB [Spirochaetota bacterium]
MLKPALAEAYQYYQNQQQIPRAVIEKLAKLAGEDILDLVSLANKVKNQNQHHYHVCTILNAKSGECSQDCAYCAQSVHHKTEIESYPLLDFDQVLKEAEKTYQAGIRNFGIVTSGHGFTQNNDQDFEAILSYIDQLKERFPGLNVCASLGILSEKNAKKLADKKILHYNINFQVNKENYHNYVASTHTIEERIATIQWLQKYGVKICCGGIIGLGESLADRLTMAYQLKELNVDVVPLNVLIPIAGTKLENAESVSVAEITKTFALFRL